MIDANFRIEKMRADECPDEFLTPFSNNKITMWRNPNADVDGKICFRFPYISWCDDLHVSPDQTMAVLVEETVDDSEVIWEEDAIETEFDLVKKGLV